jgi:exopolysaccharide production protein ExoY
MRALNPIFSKYGMGDPSGVPAGHHLEVRPRPYPLWKRAMDLLIVGALLVALAPLMLVTALLVALDGGSPLFAHRRIGQRGRAFLCLKFRTMHPDSEARLEEHLAQDAEMRSEWLTTRKLKRDPRVTRIGAFLRATSIDELPQIFNVLRGEMSIVGPRPIIEAEASHYGRHFGAYCSVKPGITGLWQVSGRNDVTYRRRVALDLTYVRRQSLLLDVAIILRTIPAVLTSKGSY